MLPALIKKPPTMMQQCNLPVLLPHQVFAVIYEHHPEEFIERLLGGNPGNVGSLWAAMDTHPGYATHPVKYRSNHQEQCIPIGLHGDGVAISGVSRSWSKSPDAFSWSSMLSRGSTIKTTLLIFAFIGS